jgi:hypothetical protein
MQNVNFLNLILDYGGAIFMKYANLKILNDNIFMNNNASNFILNYFKG